MNILSKLQDFFSSDDSSDKEESFNEALSNYKKDRNANRYNNKKKKKFNACYYRGPYTYDCYNPKLDE